MRKIVRLCTHAHRVLSLEELVCVLVHCVHMSREVSCVKRTVLTNSRYCEMLKKQYVTTDIVVTAIDPRG